MLTSSLLAFAGPHACGAKAKGALVSIQRAANLHLGVVGMAEALVGQGKPGDRFAAGVGIAKKRQNGMVVGRGAEFDGPREAASR